VTEPFFVIFIPKKTDGIHLLQTTKMSDWIRDWICVVWDISKKLQINKISFFLHMNI
jgi:hypothetical protein